MTSLPTISSLWVGSEMSYIEILCIRSFLDAGHRFRLYTLGPLVNIPEGVEVSDATEILAPPFETGPRLRHHNAVYCDLFRLELLSQRNEVWVDCDAYCLRPFKRKSGYYLGYESSKGKTNVANGVLGLPRSSPALAAARSHSQEKSPVPPFFDDAERERLSRLKSEGYVWGYHNLTWGASGPMLIDHFLQESGEIEMAEEPAVYYPGPRPFRRPLLRVPPEMNRIETPVTLSVHIFGKTKRFLLNDHDGIPPKGSWLDIALCRHGVDPADFPIPKEEMENIPRTVI